MILKEGVDIQGLQPEMLLSALIAEPVFNQFGQSPCVITSCTDGTHVVNSLHYHGLACDFRIWDVKDPAGLIAALAKVLPAKCWIEPLSAAKDHIHIEFRKG